MTQLHIQPVNCVKLSVWVMLTCRLF